MSTLKLEDSLFIGKEEFSTFQDFAINDMYKLLGLITYSYGFTELGGIGTNSNLNIANMNSFRVTSSNRLEIQISNPSYAFAYPYNLIYWNSQERIIIPDSYTGNSVWVKISYYKQSIESGTLTIDEFGNIVGVGTEFASKLRGEPNFPSRITLYAKDISTGLLVEKMTYDVTSVNSNTSIQVDSLGGIDDTSLTYYYAVAGTFEESALISKDEYYPFEYDGCRVEFVIESTINTPPNQDDMRESNSEFYIARLTIDGSGNVTVEDKRGVFNDVSNGVLKIWTLKSSNLIG